MTKQDLNRRFAELAGWKLTPEHEAAYREAFRAVGESEDTPFPVPDFISDPRLVLKEMEKREDWPEFISTVGFIGDWGSFYVDIKYIDDTTTGLLVKAAIEWLEKEEGK